MQKICLPYVIYVLGNVTLEMLLFYYLKNQNMVIHDKYLHSFKTELTSEFLSVLSLLHEYKTVCQSSQYANEF